MGKISRLILYIALSLIVLAGCTELTDNDLDPSKSDVVGGRIVEISDNQILVVSNLTESEAIEYTSEDIINDSDDYNVLTWFTVQNTRPYKEGQLVRVQFKDLDTSIPSKAKAEAIQIVEE